MTCGNYTNWGNLNRENVKDAFNYLNGSVKKTRVIKLGKVYLKLENEQITNSYKVRGASYFINHLDKHSKVITASAGNHAQGVAYASYNKNIESLVLMPKGTSTTKIMKTLNLGAKVKLFGDNYNETARKAKEVAEKEGYIYVPAYEHPLTILGQGTLYTEFVQQIGFSPKSIAVPVGGGGLITGIALNAFYNGKTKIIGVQSEKANAMYNSFHSGRLTKNSGNLETIAEGIRVGEASEIILEFLLKYVDDIVTVNDAEIKEAMRELYNKEKIISEGAGAAGYAAILYGKIKADSTIVTGGNIDKELFDSIIDKD